MEMKQWLFQHHGGASRIINDIIKSVLNLTQMIVILDFHFMQYLQCSTKIRETVEDYLHRQA